MKIIAFVFICILVSVAVKAHADRTDAMRLFDDKVTECRPPGDEGEKLVATLTKSADGGALEIHCTYHATISRAP